MNKLTAFQRALLDSVEKEYRNSAHLEASTENIPTPRRQKGALLRRSLVAALLILALVGGALAALPHVMNAQVEYQYLPLEGHPGNDSYHITFPEITPKENAPQKIETFYAPALLGSSALLPNYCCFGDQEHSYDLGNDPFYAVLPGDLAMEGDMVSYRLEWQWDETQVIFDQRVVSDLSPEDPYDINHQLGASLSAEVKTSSITLGQQDIFCFDLHFKGIVSRTWYWCDGDYLYSLHANLDEETMKELFQSIAPIEDLDSYVAAAWEAF